MDKPLVCVLMSTYNGGMYLHEQLESISRQENVIVQLVVRDDGSSDNTIDVLNSWKQKINMTVVSDSRNIGSTNSFFKLMQIAPIADYYAFSDQDDIWKPKKLINACRQLDDVKNNIKMYCSNLDLYYDGKIRGKMRPDEIRYDCYKAILENIATGCTMVFSRDLLLLINSRRYCDIIPHDHWIYLVTMFTGIVIYDTQSYIYYRQHDNQQLGYDTTWHKRLGYWGKHAHSFFMEKTRSKTARCLLAYFGDAISESKINILMLFLNYKKSLISRVVMLFDRRFSMSYVPNDIIYRIRIILGVL